VLGYITSHQVSDMLVLYRWYLLPCR